VGQGCPDGGETSRRGVKMSTFREKKGQGGKRKARKRSLKSKLIGGTKGEQT